MMNQKEAASKARALLLRLGEERTKNKLNIDFILQGVPFEEMNCLILSFVICIKVRSSKIFFRIGSEIGSVTSYIFSHLDPETMEILEDSDYEYFDKADDVVKRVIGIYEKVTTR